MGNMCRYRTMVISIISVVILSLCFSACEPLRKKFVRQKRKDQMGSRDFIPVLQPEEYPTPDNNPELKYKEHYAMLKVWYKDLWTALEEKDSEKRARFAFKQMTGHIDEMRKLVVPEKQGVIDRLSSLLAYYNSSLDTSAPFRNRSRIESDLRAFDRHLRNQCRVDKMQGNFVQ